MASNRGFRSEHNGWSGEATRRQEGWNRRPVSTLWILTVGLVLIVAALSYLNIQLGVSNGFRYAADLRFAFLLICLAFLAGAISGLTQLNKR
jgi:hypothetical protein